MCIHYFSAAFGIALLVIAKAEAFEIVHPPMPTQAPQIYYSNISIGFKVLLLHPTKVEEIVRGGTIGFLNTLNEAYPEWEFETANNDLEGKFEITEYRPCLVTATACLPSASLVTTNQSIGAQLMVNYLPEGADPSISNTHWIQRVYNNAKDGVHGTLDDKIDNLCSEEPFYDCQVNFADGSHFEDRPARSQLEKDHLWQAELYLVEVTGSNRAKIYNGIRWGWLNKDNEMSAATDLQRAATFENPVPPLSDTVSVSGEYTSDIDWGNPTFGNFSSALSVFTESNQNVKVGEPFEFGTIVYRNGTISASSGIDSISLKLDYEFTLENSDTPISGIESKQVSINNTSNQCATNDSNCDIEQQKASADFTSIESNLYLDSLYDDVLNALYNPDDLDDANNNPLGNNFHVFESQESTATLVGIITPSIIAGGGVEADQGKSSTEEASSLNSSLNDMSFRVIGFGRVIEGSGFISRTNGPANDPGNQPVSPESRKYGD